jgi:hypothetical protein
MVASMEGILEIFSLRSDIRDNTENIYRISDYVADGYVQKITRLKGDSKVVAGTVKGNLAVLDFGSAEVYCTLEIAFAHDGGVTGMSSHPSASSKCEPSSAFKSSFDFPLRFLGDLLWIRLLAVGQIPATSRHATAEAHEPVDRRSLDDDG